MTWCPLHRNKCVSYLCSAAADIKLAHTVFALPFAVLGAFLAAAWADRFPYVGELLLVLGCMFFARTFAMTMNRWLDWRFDATNPRTAGRAIPSGRVPAPAMLAISLASAGLFIFTAAGFWVLYKNAWPVMLSPLVLGWLAFYSLAKRFTSLCHAVLGLALAISPVAAAVAAEPGFLAHPPAWLLAGFVLAWVAGFDVIYALADVEHDRREGLFSLPSRLGVERALWVSRALHAVAAALVLALWWTSTSLRWSFAAAALLTVALLVLEHALVWRSERRRLEVAFFTVNGIISVLLGAAGVMDVMLA